MHISTSLHKCINIYWIDIFSLKLNLRKCDFSYPFINFLHFHFFQIEIVYLFVDAIDVIKIYDPLYIVNDKFIHFNFETCLHLILI